MPSSSLRRRTRAAIAAALGVTAPLLAGGLGSPAAAEVRPICFPVLDPVNYTDSFGAPRNGGRTHEGIDLMGSKMHRLVSAVSGVIVDLRYSGSGNNADNGVRIRGDDGYYYAYLHMNNDTPGTDDGMAPISQVFAPGITNGARVQAGQAVGFMGDSGNAEATSPHLHFEMRRPTTPDTGVWTSVAVNPYDSLRAAPICRPGLHSPTHPYTSLGGSTPSSPDATSTGPNSFDIFVRGSDGQLWTNAWAGGPAFTGWSSLAGVLRSGPSATSPGGDRIDVFARGQDDGLWTRTRSNGSWSPWLSLGGTITSDPDAASSGNGEITVAARGVDNAIWLRTFDGTTWSPWSSLGGLLDSGPGLASSAPGAVVLFAQGRDGVLWQQRSTAGTFGGWSSVGGHVTADPDVAIEGGDVHVVVRSADRRLWHTNLTAAGGWSLLSLEATGSGPAVVSWGPDRLDVVVAGTDNALYQTWWTGSGW